ncbi:alpha/beta fold hydrolase [Micromonospora endophytica]|nr:alpha/beta fold hydrolase [Micromonospora endophytica]
MTNVGFIGLGDQGAPMARAVADGGYELHLWARRPASLTILEGTPYNAHDSVASLASAVDVLLLCLRDDDDDIADLLDQRKLLDGLRPGTVVVNHGTGDPGARARTLTTFVGGEAAAYERCRPIFETFSRTVVRMGPVGTGQLTKLLNNAMTMSNLKNAAGPHAWQTIPSHFLVPTGDRNIPAAVQYFMADRAKGATWAVRGASHAVFYSQPEITASFIERAARRNG